MVPAAACLPGWVAAVREGAGPGDAPGLPCALRCGAPRVPLRELAAKLPEALFDEYMGIYARGVEDNIALRLQAEHERAVAALRRELEGAAAHGVDTIVDAHCRHIVEDVLTLKCCACGQAWVDFDACFTLQCSRVRCGAFFCAWCGDTYDSRSAAHAHVAGCEHNLNPGRLFFTEEEF
ncbi:hypothetical protein JKP88DRAFT_282416 [Tribonema minus]|uniref:C2H2-type domain-containing protein n=1 Tax=Tribonema minus TaxID=303371 RepID=A0A835YLT1_9STRA|nr:hypothetical protein JKP88DRAFT_282416 [Tribonema minus]